MRRALLVATLLLATGCDQSMDQQKRYETYDPAAVWPDGSSARPLPKGVVAQGDLAYLAASATPPAVTPALLGAAAASFRRHHQRLRRHVSLRRKGSAG